MMNELDRVLSDLTGLLGELQVDYAVMGGLAVRAYGIPRATYDVDFMIAMERERLPELLAAFRARGYSVSDAYGAGWLDEVGGMPLIKSRLYVAGRTIDVDMFLAETQFQRAIMARRRRERPDSVEVWMVSPEDLILLKLIANRPRDLADVGDVLFAQGQLDESYMKHWAETLGVSERLKTMLDDATR